MKRVLTNIGHEESQGTYRVHGVVLNKATLPGEVASNQTTNIVFYEGKVFGDAMAKLEELRTAMMTEGELPEPVVA